MAARLFSSERSEATADAEIALHARIRGEDVPHVFALVERDHLQRQLIVVAQEGAPLAIGSNVRSSAQDVDDRRPVFAAHGHIEARHDREVETHLEFWILG